MDLADSALFTRIRQGISDRIRPLPANVVRLCRGRGKFEGYARFGSGIALIIFAIILARWAQQFSAKEAVATWLRTHPPSRQVWLTTFRPFGFALPGKPSLALQAGRTLPSQIDNNHSLWFSDGYDWVAIFDREDGTEPTLLTRTPGEHPKKGPINWNLAGTGWEGLAAVVTSLSKLPAKLPNTGPSQAARRAPKSILDPREIMY